jgi:predicted transcriptional regulator
LLFGVTDKGYENLALNLSDLRAYLQQQKAIIAAYENYYQQSNKAIEEANRRLDKAEEDANKSPPEAKAKPWEIWKND